MVSTSLAQDIRDMVVNLLRGHGVVWQHTHRSDDGGQIDTDGTIRIWNALVPPIETDSSMEVRNLNSELWQGHRYFIGKTAPVVNTNQLGVGDLWVNTTTFNSYTFNFWDGHQWVSAGAGATVTWSSLTGKPSTFPSTPHALLDGNVDNDTTASTPVTGDVIFANASNLWTRLGIGSTNQVLTVVAGLPGWAASQGGASTPSFYRSLSMIGT